MPIQNAMTVDVEDYFHVSAFEKIIDREDWEQLAPRVEDNTRKILDFFAEHNIQATFFVLAWVAERFPELIRDIVKEKHELACHGYYHQRVTTMTRREFRKDITSAKHCLEDTAGTSIIGYRAPSYSIGKQNPWAHDELLGAGFRYSSSVYPIRHDLYGDTRLPRFAYQCRDGLLEIPISTTRFLQQNLPMGGGGYFRLLPYFLSRWGIRRINQIEKQSAIFYFHPWEIDPEQPRQENLPLLTRFRHYNNLEKNQTKLQRLLEDFTWGPLCDVFGDKIFSSTVPAESLFETL